ncbi:MAG: 4-hydroxybenzoate octaprenyltransferase [Gammaproteobacteria bacterium]
MSHALFQRLRQYYLLTRLHRPIGIFLLLWPTLWALWVASQGRPDGWVLFVFIAGVVLMRSAGCVINDYADRHIDPQVARTRSRPIAAGKVTPREALLVFATLCLIAFALVLSLNPLTIYLSFGGVALAILYPFMKRYTHLPQVVLGMAFGWAVPMAYAAQTGEIPRLAWLIYIITIVWSVVYDTMYAMVDREDDLKAGVKSTAILFGDADRLMIGILQGLMFVGLLLLGRELQLSILFQLALAVAVVLALYQQWLIRKREPAQCFRAFLNNNWLGAVIFVGLVLEYL